MIEAIAAGVVGVALLWWVLQPIVRPMAAPPPVPEPPDPEETPRGQALLALKEIEFDLATGKLSLEDYTSLKMRYSRAALAVLDARPVAPPPTSPPLTAASTPTATPPGIASRDLPDSSPMASADRCCRVHGRRHEADARFCAECGASLVTGSGACVACARAVPPEARFCPGCGVAVLPG